MNLPPEVKSARVDQRTRRIELAGLSDLKNSAKFPSGFTIAVKLTPQELDPRQPGARRPSQLIVQIVRFVAQAADDNVGTVQLENRRRHWALLVHVPC